MPRHCMSVDTVRIAAPALRWLIVPAAVCAAAGAMVTALRRKAIEPRLPRMSHEWLHAHDLTAGRFVRLD